MKLFRNKKNLTETEVINLAKRKSDYFGILYDKYFEQIFRFVFKRVGGMEEIAGDLTQQAFIKAMANIEKYEDRGLPFSSWLYRIAQNEVNMYFRSQKNKYYVPVDEIRLKDIAGEMQLSNNMSLEEQEKLIQVLNTLDEAQLELIELRFFQEMSFKEISEIYNITEANAKMRTYRILERIGKDWKKDS